MKRKTHKGIASRFKLTRKGKLLFRKRGFSHLLSKKSSNKKRLSKRVVDLDSNKIKFKYISLI
jgi:large subunit ribosomal protein L35